MNLRWIMLFATIAEEKSFTRAATRLNIAQPWLSAQIRKLEYHLGVQLLIRQSSGVTVTPEGKALLPYAQQLSEAAMMFRQVARTLGDAGSKSVRIGSHMPMLDISPLRAVNQEFSRAHRSFALNAEVGASADLFDRLRSSDFDFVAELDPLTADSADLDVVPLGETSFCLLSPATAPVHKIEDLAGRSVGVPPRRWHPDLIDRLVVRLGEAGAATRDVAEFDRRALEHSVKSHQAVVAIVLDLDDRALLDPAVAVCPIPDIALRHVLCRVHGRELGRAADHYWALIAERSREFMQSAP